MPVQCFARIPDPLTPQNIDARLSREAQPGPDATEHSVHKVRFIKSTVEELLGLGKIGRSVFCHEELGSGEDGRECGALGIPSSTRGRISGKMPNLITKQEELVQSGRNIFRP